MFNILVILGFILLLFLLRNGEKYETIYIGSESNIGEAMEYYWLLKNNNIPFKYHIPYNWNNLYQFGYKESPVYIKVSEKNVERASRLIMYRRIEKRKMESNRV